MSDSGKLISPPCREQQIVGPWRRMSEAPKDGTLIQVLIYHRSRRHAPKAEKAEWTSIVLAKWITHNGGGWTWNGMWGQMRGWRPNIVLSQPSPVNHDEN